MKKMIAVLAISTMSLSSTAFAQAVPPAPVVSQGLVGSAAGLSTGVVVGLAAALLVLVIAAGGGDDGVTTTTTTTTTTN
jgi:hypothetical protein